MTDASTAHGADTTVPSAAGTAAGTAVGTAADIAALHQVVAEVEKAQRAKDPDAFLALFHPDALWTTTHGKVLVGLDAVSAFTRQVLPAASWTGQVTYEAAHIQFLRPDVAAVKVRQVYHAPEGSSDEDSEGTPLYVMTKQDDGRWLLTVGQNTQVRQQEG
ncbi:SgcJ/EcaC family oxidoreductase [Streptomyces sp. WAC06614]|uniref:SgcJ/EcaC family oxidoreductase n=1 Tax=Streptomyces sp. WAC06614 TaxID=2487416 RepID=UPI000F7A0077|nr:SgcJ/EcaC family oxidoreductase [Streptomyces sp. WAC06614]RSS83376.1 SgcJ/EcaC family oxidoreductase [Streptomyces sp. WAC06614]